MADHGPKQVWLLASVVLIMMSIGLACQREAGSRPDETRMPGLQAIPTASPEVGAEVGFDRGVSYDAFYLPFDVSEEKIRGDLEFVREQGATSVYVTASEADLEDDTKISKALEIGHGLGLRVYLNPYIGGTFSGDEGGSAAGYLQNHPDAEQISRLGQTANRPSINNEQYRTYLKEMIAAFLRYDFDGILLDEPSFSQALPGDYFPYDLASREKFKAMFGHEMPEIENDEVVKFRQVTMADLLKSLFDFIKAARPDIITILVVLPDFGGQDFTGTGDWKSLSAIQSLDVFQIDPYWYPGESWDWFLANIDKLERETSGSKAIKGVWVKAFGMNGEYHLVSQTLQYLKDRRTPWLAVWVTEHLPNADMEATWREIAKVYQQR